MSELPAQLPALNKTSTPLEAISALAAALRQMRHFAMRYEIAEACAIASRMADELEFWEEEEKKRRERSDRAKRAAVARKARQSRRQLGGPEGDVS